MFYINRMGCCCHHESSFVHDQPRGFEGYLMLFVRSRAIFVIGGETYNAEPNSFIIYNKNSPQYYKACENWIYIPRVLFRSKWWNTIYR